MKPVVIFSVFPPLPPNPAPPYPHPHFPPAAKSCQTNSQSKTFSFLSQLALSSQNKFFLRSPPKFRKRAEEGSAAPYCPDGDLAAELDEDASEGQSPTTSQYENCLSAGLDCAISDLVSLDSQAEVEQGSVQIQARLKLLPPPALLFWLKTKSQTLCLALTF